MPYISLAIRFVGQLADLQFICLGNFHIPEILDIPAFLQPWRTHERVRVRNREGASIATCNDLARVKAARMSFRRSVCIREQDLS
jgi:hypothetical protein